MPFPDVSVAAILFANCFSFVMGGLTVSGVQCGQIRCQLGSYCSEFERICKPCSSICNKSHHNFDENECTKSCQDYLHDIRYVLKTDAGPPGESMENLKIEVQRLSTMVSLTLALVCFMFLVLAAVLGFQMYRWKLKKNITLKTLKSAIFKKNAESQENQVHNTTNGSNNTDMAKPDLRLDISNISTVSDHSPMTAMTTISSRRPAEDSALDYAYDNHAMSASPK